MRPTINQEAIINTCWERANQFCSNGVTQVISTTLPGKPHVQKYLANTIWASWFFRTFFILFCIFLLLFFFWLFVVSFSFGFLLFWFLVFFFFWKTEKEITWSWVSQEMRRIWEGLGDRKYDQSILYKKYNIFQMRTLF